DRRAPPRVRRLPPGTVPSQFVLLVDRGQVRSLGTQRPRQQTTITPQPAGGRSQKLLEVFVEPCPPGFFQQAGALVEGEMLRAQRARPKDLPDPGIHQGSYRLNQIASQGFAPKGHFVKETKKGIQPGCVSCARPFEMYQRVSKRQAGIDRVARRTAIPVAKAERLREQGSEGPEIRR